MIDGRRPLVFAFALAALASARPAAAYCRTTTCTGDCARDAHGCFVSGKPIAWPGLCVGYSLSEAGTRQLSFDDVRGAAARAFAAWSGLACDGGADSIAFSELSPVSCDKAEYDQKGPNANIVMFRDDGWPYDNAEDTLALTTVTFNTDTADIYDADVEVNSAQAQLRVTDTGPGVDLQAILTHEAGHVLGLAHSDDSSAVMAPTYSPSMRAPAPDDVAGACAAYPPGRAGTCDSTPRHGFGTTCAAPAADAGGGCSASRPPTPLGLGVVAIGALVAAIASRRRSA